MKFVAQLLKMLVDKEGSDLFITVGTAPALKIHGEIMPVINRCSIWSRAT